MYNGLHVRHVVRSKISNAMNTNSLSYQFSALSLTPLGLYEYPVMLYPHPVTYQIHPFSLVVFPSNTSVLLLWCIAACCFNTSGTPQSTPKHQGDNYLSLPNLQKVTGIVDAKLVLYSAAVMNESFVTEISKLRAKCLQEKMQCCNLISHWLMVQKQNNAEILNKNETHISWTLIRINKRTALLCFFNLFFWYLGPRALWIAT